MGITLLIQTYPKSVIILFSFLVSLVITLVSYYVTDHEKMRSIKDKQKRLREEMKLHKDNPQKMMEINKQMMEDFPTQMKESFKTSLITLVPILFLFRWLKTVYATTAIASTWIWWYIGFSILSSIILRKMFKLD